jgi:hypothetical protein
MSEMPTLTPSAAVRDFPDAPRRVVSRKKVLTTRAWIGFWALVVLVVGAVVFTRRVHRIDLLLRSSNMVGAQVTSKEVRSGKETDNHYVYFRATSEHGPIEGQYRLPPEEWDEVNVGQSIPIWYATEDPSINQRQPPSESQRERARISLLIFLSVAGALTACVFWGFEHAFNKERKLATYGLPILARFDVKSTRSGSDLAQSISWNFTDGDGTSRTLTWPTSTTYREAFDTPTGHCVILVPSDSWEKFKPWPEFIWVDVLDS